MDSLVPAMPATRDPRIALHAGLCAGKSGVLEKIGDKWKIKQYVLSMTVPNDVSNEVIKIKSVGINIGVAYKAETEFQ